MAVCRVADVLLSREGAGACGLVSLTDRNTTRSSRAEVIQAASNYEDVWACHVQRFVQLSSHVYISSIAEALSQLQCA